MKVRKSHLGSTIGIIAGFLLIPGVVFLDHLFFSLFGPGEGVLFDYYMFAPGSGMIYGSIVIFGSLAYKMRKKQKFAKSKKSLVLEIISLAITLFVAVPNLMLGMSALLSNSASVLDFAFLSEIIFLSIVGLWVITAYLIVLFSEPLSYRD